MYTDEQEKKSAVSIVLVAVFVGLLLIVGIIIAIITVAGGQLSSSSSEEQERISSFNSGFSSYEGSGVSSTNVKSLIESVRVSNNISGKSISMVFINSDTDERTGYSQNVLDMKSVLDDSNTYNVSCIVDSSTGYIKSIEVTGSALVVKTEFEELIEEIKLQEGKIIGSDLNDIIDDIVASNNKEEEKIAIEVIFIDGNVLEISADELYNRDVISMAPDLQYYELLVKDKSASENVQTIVLTYLES